MTTRGEVPSRLVQKKRRSNHGRMRPALEPLEPRRLLSTFVVDNTADSGAGSLRQAILSANADPNPGTDNIFFNIPASTAPELNVPVAGFDPGQQLWTIAPASPLPAITRAVNLDAFTQGESGVPFLYPGSISSDSQFISLSSPATGGSFTLTTSSPLPIATSAAIPYDATAAVVQSALEAIVGAGNVVVTGGPLNTAGFTVAFQGAYGSEAIPPMTATSSFTGSSTTPVATVSTAVIGGVAGTPTYILSVPNSAAAESGYNAQVRVLLEGGLTTSGSGLVVDAPNVTIRGLAIDGFTTGVTILTTGDSGDLVQGDFIGQYLVYPVDTQTGSALPAPNNVELLGSGNLQQGIVIQGQNATVGGIDPQAADNIAGNGLQGVLIEPGATGNQVLNCQIGVVGPSSNGRYFDSGNGAEGVLIESSGSSSNPASIVYASSNTIGGAVAGSGNEIAANFGDGIHLEGPGTTRNLIEANFIGVAPGGGFIFGTGDPGNHGNGVFLDGAPDNQIGGSTAADGNVIADNGGAGVDLNGADATGNTLANNIIGLISSGTAVLGNALQGVADYSPSNTIGPANVISANLVGVLISGSQATNVLVKDNLIGTDSSGTADLGNALQGVLIENATDNVIQGNGQGSQVISGNQIGVQIDGSTSTRNLVDGNFIGVDKTGSADRGNADEGVLIENAFGNTIGGTTAAAANVISANQWGVHIDGATASQNLVVGNLIGTDSTGTKPLGNEINGILITTSASNNTLGGTVAGAGNTIAFNVAAGVSVASGTGDSILSNSIFSNGRLGIDLVAPGDPASGVTPNQPGVRVGPNDLQNYPVIVAAVGGAGGQAQATLNSLPLTSFLIQFYSSPTPDPSGYGQGETLLQSQTVTTDSSGNASADLAPPGGLAPNAWITATATNLATGDTSEFSAAVSAQPVSVQLNSATQSVNATAGSVVIQVNRVGNLNALVSVDYATSNGTAQAGQDYTAVSGVLTFQPGQTIKTFSVPILENIAQTAASTTVNLALTQPTGGATLSTPATEVLTIVDNLPPLIEFSSATYAVQATSGDALVTVARGGSLAAAVTANFSASGGTAAPGVDYTPVSGTLTFLAGQTRASFTVPVFSDPTAPNPSVGLTLSSPTGGASLGAIATAALTLLETPPVPPSPAIVSEQIVAGPGGITAIVLGFSVPLDPVRAQELANYGYFLIIAGPGGSFSAADSYASLSQAIYNASANTVTLLTASPLPLNHFYQLTVDGRANVYLNAGITNTAGGLMVGADGIVGDPYVSRFGAGTHLAYTDPVGNLVTLSLAHGGPIQIDRTAAGAVSSLEIIGSTTRKSILTGSVRRQFGSSGRTTLPDITGAPVRIKLRKPGFQVGPTRPSLVLARTIHARSPFHARPAVGKPAAQARDESFFAVLPSDLSPSRRKAVDRARRG